MVQDLSKFFIYQQLQEHFIFFILILQCDKLIVYVFQEGTYSQNFSISPLPFHLFLHFLGNKNCHLHIHGKKTQNFELNTSISIPNFDTHLCLVTKLQWDKLLNIGNKSQKSIMQLSGCNICTTKRLEQQLNNIRKAERGTPLYHLNPGHSSRFNSSCPTYDFNVQSCDAIKQDHLYFLLPYYEPNRICCGKFLSIFVTLQNSQK